MIQPIVKYAGGKMRLLPELLRRLPQEIDRYVEPFCGSAALYFALWSEGRIKGPALIADANEDLIALYEAVAANAIAVAGAIEDLNDLRTKIGAEPHYYSVRDQWNARTTRSAAWRAARYVYLNRCGYNGLWRVNRKGEHNVPFGRYGDPLAGVPQLILDAAPALRAATLVAADYRDVLDHEAVWRRRDFVDHAHRTTIYADPPYDGMFGAYTHEAFDQEVLPIVLGPWRARGAHVLASNADTPRIRALWAGWRIEEVEAWCSIGGKKAKRGARKELLIS